MVYSDVVNGGLILPRRLKYTMRDVNSLMVNSLFAGGKTIGIEAAIFIVKCSAVFHDTDYSKSLSARLSPKMTIA